MSFFSLPIPQSLKYATMMLPLGSGALLQLGWQLESRQKQKKRPTQFPFANLLSMAVLIASTTILTLLGTYAAPIMAVPGTADCSLELKWKALFRDKNAAVIRNIQNNFSCCGFRNAQHMAWPFPDRNHGADACESTFRRTNGCLPEWRSEQQKLAGLLMGCVVFLLIWVVRQNTH